MGLFREAKFEWGGVDYTFTPSMKLLAKIEEEGLSSEKISYQAMQGNIMKVAMSRFCGIVMREAGMDITDERLLQEIEHNANNAIQLFTGIRNALYTEPPEEMLLGISKDEGGKKKSAVKKG